MTASTAPTVTPAPEAAPVKAATGERKRRDKLVAIEKETQSKWHDNNTYTTDAPKIDIQKGCTPDKFPSSKSKNGGQGILTSFFG